MSDKYDEKAGKVCAILRSIRSRVEGGYDEERSYIGAIADALREAAHEARPVAGKVLSERIAALESPPTRDGGSSMEYTIDECSWAWYGRWKKGRRSIHICEKKNRHKGPHLCGCGKGKRR